MTVILTVYICIRGFCIETYVPTPATFRCDDPSYYEKYLASGYTLVVPRYFDIGSNGSGNLGKSNRIGGKSMALICSCRLG
jgi:hypothetical protein